MTRRFSRGRLLGAALLAAAIAAPEAAGQLFKQPNRLYRVGPNPSAIAAADLNNDGWPDIVTADTGALADPREERPANDEVSILLSRGPAEFTRYSPSLKSGFAPYDLVIANVDALKWPDIIVVNFLATRQRDISLFRNLQGGVFETVEYRLPEDFLDYYRHRDGDGFPVFTKPGLTALAIHDINRDGFRDLIATAWASDALVVMPGNAETYFGDPRFIRAPGGPRDLRLADLNGNGHLDIAVTLSVTGEIGIWRGNGAGEFEPEARVPSRGRLPHRIRIADMNRDGIPDLIVSHRHTEDSIVIFYGDGNFRYEVTQKLMLGEDRAQLEHDIRDIVVTDLNGNGRPDIAAACHASREVNVFLNAGEGTGKHQNFRRETYTFSEGRPQALCVEDFDQDGRPDLAVALDEANAVALLVSGGRPLRENPAAPPWEPGRTPPPGEEAETPALEPLAPPLIDPEAAEDAAPGAAEAPAELDPRLLLEPLEPPR